MDSEPTPIAEGLGMSIHIRGAMTKVMTIEEARGVALVSTRTLDKARACAKPVMGPAKFSTRFNLGEGRSVADGWSQDDTRCSRQAMARVFLSWGIVRLRPVGDAIG